jgi:molybdenum cofactor cytidylyltransferase
MDSRDNARTPGTPPPGVTGAILAAGLGTRMGHRPKCTLRIAGASLLERMVSALQEVGVTPVHVVVGPYPEQLLPLISRSGARAWVHTHTAPSLADSQALALQAHQTHFSGHDLLLVVADLPLLTVLELHPLLNAWRQRAAHVHALRPVVNGVPGHPLLLSADAVRQVAEAASPTGIRDWLREHPDAVQPFHSAELAYITDLDTPDDVLALQRRLVSVPVAWPSP